MSHLILHIGLHKTGTTSLQQLCFHRADELARRGVIYPRLASKAYPDGVPAHHGLILNLARYFPEYMLPEGQESVWDDLVAVHAASDRTVLISSEEFSRGRAGFRVDMARLGQIARNFDKVTVVCVLREQIGFLQSVFLERSKGGDLITVPWLLNNAMTHNDAAGLWADWRPLYDHLLTGFTPNQLHFIDYQTARATPGGVIGAVLGIAGLTYRPGASHVPHNISAPPLAQLLCLPFFAPRPVPATALQSVQAAIHHHFGPDRPTTLFTRSEVAAIRAHFTGANADLISRICDVQPDFTLDWPDLPTRLLYRDDLGDAESQVLISAGLHRDPTVSQPAWPE